jgi:hypothetical protein
MLFRNSPTHTKPFGRINDKMYQSQAVPKARLIRREEEKFSAQDDEEAQEEVQHLANTSGCERPKKKKESENRYSL